MNTLHERTIRCLLDRSASLYRDRPALSWVDGPPLTYGELHQKARSVSALLQEFGIMPGDRVAILGENMPNWGVAYLAVTTMGAVVVPILPDFHPSEVHHILKHAQCKAIFISNKLMEKLQNGEFDSLRAVIVLDELEPVKDRESLFQSIRGLVREGEKEVAKIKQAALRLAGRQNSRIQEDDLAAIIYTSGTTGHSKGVMLSHRNIVSNVLYTLEIQPVVHTDRLLSILPLSHTYENTIGFMIPMMQGACVYYLDKPPVPRVLLPAMAKIKPTMMLTVPLIMEKIFKTKVQPSLTANALLRRLYKTPSARKMLHRAAGRKIYKSFGGHIHFFGIGGAKISAEVEQFLRDAQFPYAIGYGLTETAPLIAGSSPALTRFQSTGKVIPGVEVKIHDADRETGEGEIWTRSDCVMQGYYKDPETTKQVLTSDGWFRTGDLGVLDADGYLYIKGRMKNVIVGPSGENIYPEEIEMRINESEHVLESLVVQREGQLMARIHLNYEELDREFGVNRLNESQIKERIQELLEAIKARVNEKVSGYSRIRKIMEQSEPFEKTPTKKIKRYLYE